MKSKQASSNKRDTGSKIRDKFTFTRRETLLGTIISGVVTTSGAQTVSANENEDGEITVSGVGDNNTKYAQFKNGEMEELMINGGTEFSIDLDGGENSPLMNEKLNAAIDVAINRDIDSTSSAEEKLEDDSSMSDMDGKGAVDSFIEDVELIHTNWVNVAETSKTVTDGVVEFTLEDIHGGPFDFAELDEIYDGDEKYENLGVGEHPIGEDFVGIPRNKNTFEIRFRMGDDDGSLYKEKTVEFTIDVTAKLGMGHMFGRNFGRNHIEAWPENWENS